MDDIEAEELRKHHNKQDAKDLRSAARVLRRAGLEAAAGAAEMKADSLHQIPREPTGDKAVVRDRDGDVWVRWNQGWLCNDAVSGNHETVSWYGLDEWYGPLTVLSEGIDAP